MEKEGDLRLSPEEKNLMGEEPEKKHVRIGIPYGVRFALVWVIFFAIIGIVIQTVRANSFVFIDFFFSNYGAWFRSFGTFTDPTAYATGIDLFFAIIREWYYFLYTGGLISLLWAIINGIIHHEIIIKGKPEEPKPEPKPLVPVTAPKKEEPAKPSEIDQWLTEGYKLLALRRIRAARLIYGNIRRQYDSSQDPDRDHYNRILDFHKELVEYDQRIARNKAIRAAKTRVVRVRKREKKAAKKVARPAKKTTKKVVKK